MIVAGLRGLSARLAAGSLSRNGVFALGQSLAVTACMFLAYRIVIAQVGLERLGVWSLLLAGSALVRIGDVSGGGALARFVALASRDGEPGRCRDTVHTVTLTSLALNAAIGFAIWAAAPFVLPLFVAPAYMGEAQVLVPYVVATIVLGGVATAVTSGIDGAQRADRRAIVVVASSLVFLVTCIALVPGYGVLGFGAAQVLQQVAMLVLGWLVLQRHVPGLGWLPRHWRRDVFAETTGYAMKLNGISLVGMLFEPLAKFAFNHTGGPGLVALYDLASRLIVQVRGLAVSAATPLIPAFAAQSGAAEEFRSTLEKSTRIAALAALGAAVVTLVAAPLASLFVLGKLSPELLALNAALTLGWSINIMCVPIYFAGQALDVLRWNFAAHAAMAASVVVGAFVLAPLFGGPGLIGAIVGGLVLGMLVALLGNAHAFGALGVMYKDRWLLLGTSAVISVLSGVVWFANI